MGLKLRPRLIKHAKRQIVHTRQTATRKLSTAGLKQVFQANYFELARSTDWLREPPFASPQGGTANYSMLYILLSVLRDPKISNALEFGVGSSSRLLAQWGAEGDRSTLHIEDDSEWLERALDEAPNRELVHAPLGPAEVSGRSIQWYEAEQPQEKFQLVSVDGPRAWPKSRQYNRLGVLSWIPEVLDDEFVILIDDASRRGEATLASAIAEKLEESGIEASSATYNGASSQVVFATPAFAHALYL